MDMLRACVFVLVAVAAGASPQEDATRAPGRFYISLSEIPLLGSLFAHHTGNNTAGNKTTTMKHVQFYPILPSLVSTPEGQQNAAVVNADVKADCNQHNNPHSEGTQKLTTTAPLSGADLDSKFQSKPATETTDFKPNYQLPPHHNVVIPAPAVGQNHPSLMFQNPFSPTKQPSNPNAVQIQVASSTASSVTTSKTPEFFHSTEASPTTSKSTERPSGNHWPESFGIPSYPIMPGYPNFPTAPQKPHVSVQQNAVNTPQYPFFPFDHWSGAPQMPGVFGIPEGAVNFPTGVFQHSSQFVQVPQHIKAQVHYQPYLNIWATKQPQNSEQSTLNPEKQSQQTTIVIPQTTQQTSSTQDHHIHHMYRPISAQHNWNQPFPYISYQPQGPVMMTNPQGIMQYVLPDISHQNSVGSSQQT